MWGDNLVVSSSSAAESPVGWRSSGKKFAGGFYNNKHYYAEAEQNYADDEWHFAVQVGSSSTGLLYVDGELIDETSHSYKYNSNPYFLIGARTKNSESNLDNVEYFKGILDELAIWNRTLNSSEISSLYNSGSGRELVLEESEEEENEFVVSLVCPSNNTELNYSDIGLVYNITGSGTISNCSLFIDNLFNSSDDLISKDVNQTFNISFADGS